MLVGDVAMGYGYKLGRAIRYSPQEGKITIQIYSENDQVVLRVRDTGL
jgi:signal transduction histidine kinase